MNWYPHHLGDFAQATAHLSMLEDAAYSRLLRWYYAEEQPIPADLRAACRIARATSNDEREAVRVVLEEFFELTADGYRQARADREIEAYRDKSAKAARSAEARWSNKRTQCGRNANASGIDANASKGDADAMLANSQQPTYSVPIGTGAAPPMLPPAAAPAGDLLPLPADPVKVLFDAGVSLLTAAGVSDRQARSLIGQWRRTAGDADVLAAIVRCRDQRITAPVPWLSAALRPRAQRKPSALHLPANLNYETSL